jgi:hypothetical protein
MSLKSAALLALVGTSLVTLVLLVNLAGDGWALLDGVVPLVRFVTSLIRALAGVSVVVFLYVFQKAQR